MKTLTISNDRIFPLWLSRSTCCTYLSRYIQVHPKYMLYIVCLKMVLEPEVLTSALYRQA